MRKLLEKLLHFLNRHKITVNLHGFNYAGENTVTMHCIVDELCSDSEHYVKGDTPYNGYLQFKNNYFWPSLVLSECKIVEKLNSLDKEKNEQLYNLLKSNQDKALVLTINDLGTRSLHGNVAILKFNGEWYHESFRNS